MNAQQEETRMGILPAHAIEQLIEQKSLLLDRPADSDQVQPVAITLGPAPMLVPSGAPALRHDWAPTKR